MAWFKKGFADQQNANKKIAQKVFVPKAPFTQGRLMVEPVYG